MPDDVQVIDQVESAVDAVSPETTPVSEVAPATPSRSEQINALAGKAREHWKLTGDLEAARKLAAPKADTETSTTEELQPAAGKPAETEAAPGPAQPEQPQPRTKADRDFRTVVKQRDTFERELIAVKAKLEILERQSAARGPSAPATTPETKPVESVVDDDPRPDIDAYDDAQKWQKDDTAWLNRQWDKRLAGEQQKQQYQHSNQKWTEQIESARKQFPDYDKVVFSDKVPLSYATLATIQALPDGAGRGYVLAKDLKKAAELAELTHIPGEHQFQSLPAFLKWVKADPERAMLYGEKLAAAKAEVAKLSVTTKAAPQAPRPLKEIVRSAPQPSAEVNTDTTAAPILDPIAKALQNIKNNVPGAMKEYRRLKNEEDLRDRRSR